MTGTIVVVGYGPGISRAVAERFGAAGFAVALVARSADRLAEGVAALKDKGIKAAGYAADAGDPASIAGAIETARGELGPIGVLHWNAYGGARMGDLLTLEPSKAGPIFDVAIVGLLAATQAVLPDLKTAGDGALLVTNGAFGELNPMIDAMALAFDASGVAIGNAAKAKLVGLLAERLKAEGVHVGEVTVAGMVNGTASAPDGGGIDPARIAEAFWELYEGRSEVRARIT